MNRSCTGGIISISTNVPPPTMKACRHLGSLSLGKLTDKLENTSPLNLNSCKKNPAEPDNLKYFTCLTCLESFCQADSVHHYRVRNHPLFYIFGGEERGDGPIEDAFYCSCCAGCPKIKEPGKKERVGLEKIKTLFERNQNNSPSVTVSKKDYVMSKEDDDLSFKLPRGIVNLGNTCFMNSALQLLACTLHRHGGKVSTSPSPIWNSLLHHLEEIYSSSDDSKQKHHNQKQKQKQKDVNPREFLTLLMGKQKKFASMQQQDAHDFLRSLFNSSDSSKKEKERERENSSPLHTQLFGGKFVSRVRCGGCNSVTCTFEPFLDISLSISTDSIEDYISKLSIAEESESDLIKLIRNWNNKILLEGENGYYCEKCSDSTSSSSQSSLQNASLQFFLSELPQFFIFHLQRFKTNFRTGGKKKSSGLIMEIEKDERLITFPLNLKIPKECTIDSIVCSSYKLYGYIVHEGSSTSFGHYTAVVCPSSQADRWFYISDTRVTEISKSRALDGETHPPYLLFYQKEED